jgi:5-methylcytosine-specific restriction protein A
LNNRTLNTLIYGVPRSPQWKEVRQKWLSEHNECVVCRKKTMLNVHHIKPFHLYPELELDPINFITLCEHSGLNCHFLIGHSADWLAYNPNVVEDSLFFRSRLDTRLFTRQFTT